MPGGYQVQRTLLMAVGFHALAGLASKAHAALLPGFLNSVNR